MRVISKAKLIQRIFSLPKDVKTALALSITRPQNISKYAINLGIIFQMIDDILGTFGDEKITGKPTNGDIREGKKTCLLIDALEKLDY
ncbi:unnamed protein product, partial [marine sediment metagenome]